MSDLIARARDAARHLEDVATKAVAHTAAALMQQALDKDWPCERVSRVGEWLDERWCCLRKAREELEAAIAELSAGVEEGAGPPNWGWALGVWAPYRKLPVVVRARRLAQPMTVETLEGPLTANSGDWLVEGVQRELYPVRDEIFRATYEPAEEAAPGEEGAQ